MSEDTPLSLLGEVIDWLGVSDWTGPQLPHDLARRIARLHEATDPKQGPGLVITPSSSEEETVRDFYEWYCKHNGVEAFGPDDDQRDLDDYWLDAEDIVRWFKGDRGES